MMAPFHPPLRRQADRTEDKATVSFVLGLFSLACGGPILGLPAMILGSIARREIDRAGGARSSSVLAAFGIVSGLFGTGLGLVVVLWTLNAVLIPVDATAESTSDEAPSYVTSEESSPAPAPTAFESGTRSYGSLEVVDLDDSRSLRSQLAEITLRSRGRVVVLQTYEKSSSACAAVAAALPNTHVYRALANVTLVRVDIDEYDAELRRMQVETRSAPWFYKLDAEGVPTDALSADAWDTDVPEHMASVLGRFVRSKAPRKSSPGARREYVGKPSPSAVRREYVDKPSPSASSSLEKPALVSPRR